MKNKKYIVTAIIAGFCFNASLASADPWDEERFWSTENVVGFVYNRVNGECVQTREGVYKGYPFRVTQTLDTRIPPLKGTVLPIGSCGDADQGNLCALGYPAERYYREDVRDGKCRYEGYKGPIDNGGAMPPPGSTPPPFGGGKHGNECGVWIDDYFIFCPDDDDSGPGGPTF